MLFFYSSLFPGFLSLSYFKCLPGRVWPARCLRRARCLRLSILPFAARIDLLGLPAFAFSLTRLRDAPGSGLQETAELFISNFIDQASSRGKYLTPYRQAFLCLDVSCSSSAGGAKTPTTLFSPHRMDGFSILVTIRLQYCMRG